MDRRTSRRVLALGLLGIGLGIAPNVTYAQFGATGGASATPNGTAPAPASGLLQPFGAGSGMYANPYTNPYMNPFLNPYATGTPTSAGNAALFFMAAQQRNGGLGSGRIGGPNAPAPGRGGRASVATMAEPTRRVSDTPGGSASRYFNRTSPTSAGPARYYNRQKGQ